MANLPGVAEIIFLAVVAATFGVAWIGRRHARSQDDLGGRTFNRWFVGLSAGTTANSGFVVTAAVGLGYSYGAQWLLLPLGWLLGDLVFWSLFPHRINAYGRRFSVATLPSVLRAGLQGTPARMISVLAALIIVLCLSGYTSAQWVAGQKFLAGAFDMPELAALLLFALTIIAYSAIGGFTGSIYADTLQAVIRVGGTVIAMVAIGIEIQSDSSTFASNIKSAGAGFLNPLPNGSVISALAFLAGFAGAAIGFGLGQPQILTRYLAGSSPEETRAARWIYIGFVQFTWISMTVFGILLRGVMPGIDDPEAGLSVFFRSHINQIATGIIVADIFATIAATSNGLLIAMAQSIKFDLLPEWARGSRIIDMSGLVLLVGAVSMLLSQLIHGTVVTLALSSVSMMGAGLAAAVIVKVCGWRHNGSSLISAMLMGLFSAALWKWAGLGAFVNEAGVGMLAGMASNWYLAKRAARVPETARTEKVYLE